MKLDGKFNEIKTCLDVLKDLSLNDAEDPKEDKRDGIIDNNGAKESNSGSNEKAILSKQSNVLSSHRPQLQQQQQQLSYIGSLKQQKKVGKILDTSTDYNNALRFKKQSKPSIIETISPNRRQPIKHVLAEVQKRSDSINILK